MKAVIQRVNFAKLKVNNKLFSEISNGLVVLIGITHHDDINDIKWLVKKILNLRTVSYTHLTLPTKRIV